MTTGASRSFSFDRSTDAAVTAQPRHYHLKLDYGKPTERIVSFATQAERLAAATAALKEERKT